MRVLKEGQKRRFSVKLGIKINPPFTPDCRQAGNPALRTFLSTAGVPTVSRFNCAKIKSEAGVALLGLSLGYRYAMANLSRIFLVGTIFLSGCACPTFVKSVDG